MNNNLQGGYYIVSLGGVDILGESVSLPNIAKLLYEAKKHKFVVLQDIVMDGEKKTAIPVLFDATMALTTEPEDWNEETDGEFVPEPIYTATIYNVYGKNIAIDADGVASVTDYDVSVDPTTLYGKFVRLIEPPQSDTLTEEQVEIFEQGVFVNGVYLGYINPVFFPVSKTYSGLKWGIAILPGDRYGSVGFYQYTINDSTRKLTIGKNSIGITANALFLTDVTNVNGKSFPAYPQDQTDKTYVLKLVNGTLTWVEETA